MIRNSVILDAAFGVAQVHDGRLQLAVDVDGVVEVDPALGSVLGLVVQLVHQF